MKKTIPVTINFDQSVGGIIGKLDIDDSNVLAQSVLRNIDHFMFEAGYIKNEDGTVELLEISAVRRDKS